MLPSPPETRASLILRLQDQSDRVRESVSESSWEAFWRTSVEERPIREVADELGQSVGSIYIARSRVMKRLKQCVKQYEELTDD